MSFWEIFQELDEHFKRNILTELESTYGGSFEFETFIYLVQWMESQCWDQAIDSSYATQVINAKGLMDATITQLNEQKKKLDSMAFGNFQNVLLAKKVQEVANQLQEKYGNSPVQFAKCFHNIVSKLRELVQTARMSASGELSTVEPEDMSMDDNVPTDPYINVLKDLEALKDDSQKNDGLLKEIEQLKEQYVIRFQEVTSKVNRLQIEAQKLQGNSSTQLSEAEKTEKLLQIKQDGEGLQQELSKMGEELSITKRLALIESMGNHLKKLSEMMKSVLDEIAEWRHLQQRSLCGFPSPQSLDKLQTVCEFLAELLWKLFQQSSQLDNLFRQAFQGNEVELRRMENVKNTTRNLLSLFLNKTFIIEKQPPQVLKKETKFGATLLHLIGGKLNIQFHPPEVQCSLISEKQAQSMNVAGRPKSSPTNNSVLNNKKAFEYNQETRKLMVEFKNLSLTKANRQGGKNKEVVTEEKSAVLFSTQINLGKEVFNVSVMSVPVVVTVHGNQQCDAEATVFWENAFAEKERKLFDVPDQVEWFRLAEALNNYWMLRNGRALNAENIAYLGSKITPAKVEGGIENALITRHMFNRENMSGRSFSFWKWFYGALDVVYRRLVEEWRDGHVAGFLSKKDAHDTLSGKLPGTFLLRFSDSELGGVSVAYVAQLLNGQHEIWDLAPWTSTNLNARKFADRLKDLQELVTLYPDKPKDEAFGRYYTNDESEATEDPTGYRRTVLAVKLPGNPACRSPAYQGANNFMDTLPPGSFPLPNMTEDLFPGSPVSPQSVDSSAILEGDLGVGSQEIVGDVGSLASDITLSDVFLSGLQAITPGPASWVAAMVANLGGELDNYSLLDDSSSLQSQ